MREKRGIRPRPVDQGNKENPMHKVAELNNPTSCLNRAKNEERIFVLLERDVAAPETIRFWAAERVRQGKNHPADRQIQEAVALAAEMEAVRAEKAPNET
jgi:hypothetical protein